MEIWQTFGHESVKSILARQLELKTFAHAYLLQGPEGVGKKTLALEFAKQLLVTQKPESHPDFQILDTEGEISIESVRDFISKLSFKPFLSAKKIAIINNAHNLNQQSSNALLKTLEEPSPSTIIVLIANPGSLLPTIISRCQVLNFSLLSQEQLSEAAKKLNIQANPQIISLSFGSIGRLKKLAGDKEFLRNQELSLEKYKEIGKMPIAEKFLAISGYSELENNDLEQNLTTWMNWQARELENVAENYTKLRALSESLLGLKMNKNKKMLLQSLFLKI